MKHRSLIGQKFGRLTVVDRAPKDARGKLRWVCRCDCGGETTSYGFSLTSGRSSSCGCVQREWAQSGQARQVDLVGRRYGRLTVIERSSRQRWLTSCDCGNTTVVKTNKLTSGWTLSCGCLQSDLTIQRNEARAGLPNLAARKPRPTYSAAHRRISRERGKAREHTCVDCEGKAAHWSYTYGDPDELTDSEGRVYSTDTAYYAPRCAPCHRGFDTAQRATSAASC